MFISEKKLQPSVTNVFVLKFQVNIVVLGQETAVAAYCDNRCESSLPIQMRSLSEFGCVFVRLHATTTATTIEQCWKTELDGRFGKRKALPKGDINSDTHTGSYCSKVTTKVLRFFVYFSAPLFFFNFLLLPNNVCSYQS